MASYKIVGAEPQAGGKVNLDVFVFPTGADTDDNATAAGHFTVVLDAGEVNAAFALPVNQQGAVLKALFEQDTRIAGIVAAEEAASSLNARYIWPIVIIL